MPEDETLPDRSGDPQDPNQTRTRFDWEQQDHAESVELPGQKINQYTLVRLLGEGGFGTVWLAEQQEPVRRQVAMKIIKLGMDTRQVIARFEAERQALAVMDHPNIAKVFDAGSTESGRPYFVMEYAEGLTFTKYCDEHKLEVRDRLRLFQKVCHAVQHAHQKGIIHRDIKPSNVLVTSVDGEPSPKVIDFGIAKATEARLTEHSMFTQQGQIVGTPAYMSPEQAGQTTEDIDTRADVYALGVLLYEAMTGDTPFNAKTLLSAGMAEIRRIIREVDPPKPSTRLTTASEDMTTVAQYRATEPRRLGTLLSGDIDWIVMKAIEKDRGRRYQTASSFAEDIEHFLRNEPVLASPPSTRYRLGKFVRRNRPAVIAGGLIIAALLAGTVGTTIGLVRATHAEGLALQAAADADDARELEAQQRRLADASAEEARLERDKAEQVAEFLTDMLSGVGAQVAQGADTTLLREILNKTAVRVGDELVSQPEIEAEIRSHLGDTYLQLRDFERADENLRRAYELYKSVRDDDDPELAASLGDLGIARSLQGRYDEAVDLHREALAMWRRLDTADKTAVPWGMVKLANSLVRLEAYEEADQLLLAAVEMMQLELGENHEDVGVAYNSLANLKQNTEDFESAETYYLKALAAHRESLGEEHPFVATNLHNLANLLARIGRNREAIEMHEDALARARALYPDGHEQIASGLVQLATLYRYDDERSPEAPGMLREAIELQSRLYGEVSQAVAESHHDLGRILDAQRDREGAIVEYQRASDLYAALYGEESQNVTVSMQAIARSLAYMERYDEASDIYDRVIEIQAVLFGDAHPDRAITLVDIGAMHRQAGNYEAAEEALLRSLAIFDAADMSMTTYAASALENLGRVYRAGSRIEESADALRRALDVRHEAQGPNSRGTLGASYALSGTLIEIEAFEEAEALLVRVFEDPEGVIDGRTRLFVKRRHAELLFASKRYDECEAVLEECYLGFRERQMVAQANEALTELVRTAERRHELDPSPANEAARSKWQQLLEEQS